MEVFVLDDLFELVLLLGVVGEVDLACLFLFGALGEDVDCLLFIGVVSLSGGFLRLLGNDLLEYVELGLGEVELGVDEVVFGDVRLGVDAVIPLPLVEL